MTSPTELRALAEAATPGPWLHEGWSEKVTNSAVMYAISDSSDADNPDDWLLLAEMDSAADAAFIAACSPDAILALLDRLDGVERELKVAMKVANAALEFVREIKAIGDEPDDSTAPGAIREASAQERSEYGDELETRENGPVMGDAPVCGATHALASHAERPRGP